MYWLVLLTVPLAIVLWGSYPRPLKAAEGRGADESHLAGPVRAASTLRVATFNIHGGRGRDGVRNLERVARDLESTDIAALQEVHDSWRAPRQLERLAAMLARVALAAPARRRWFRDHRCNALLSRHAVGRWSRMPLKGHPAQRFHYRNLTVARIELPRPVWVLFTHLNREQGRDEQLEQVMREFLKYSPAILMGDFNTSRNDPALLEYLARGDVTDALGQNLDDDDPERIDWILCRGVVPLRAGMIDSGASDHPLYWCDVEIPDVPVH
ncbi:MAG TPA: endonuclease/exonuclease/phosphatase family protein [Arenicellales bacterium]|nr:endonuclease/exonuclease/phosphatase family protein [Arenicellales bacterium]